VPSPRQNVEEEAPVPEFKFVTNRLPVTSEPSRTVQVLLAQLSVLFVRTCVLVSVASVLASMY
jgi:hypothetical protein